ncbi:MAG: PAC2 family protein [Candidatus Diapherotrites archaeon]
MKREFAKVDIVEFKSKSLKGYTLIEGFPGMGLVGTIGAKYLVEKMEFRKYGYISSNIFIPIIRIREGKPVYPSRIFINEKKKLVAIISEQIIPNQFLDDFARAIIKWVKQKGISRVVSLSGIQSYGKEAKGDVYGIAANEKSKKILRKAKIDLIQEGITSGISALILLDLKTTNIEAFSILSNISSVADYQAASRVIETLNKIIGLKIDVKPLLKEAKNTEKELREYMDNLKKTQDNMQRMEPQGPSYTA